MDCDEYVIAQGHDSSFSITPLQLTITASIVPTTCALDVETLSHAAATVMASATIFWFAASLFVVDSFHAPRFANAQRSLTEALPVMSKKMQGGLL